MSWKGRKVLVTGAGGFIGSHLSESLVRAGAEVRALVRYNGRGDRGWLEHSSLSRDMDVVSGDVTDYDCVHTIAEGREVVFHLAALIAIPYSYAAPHSYIRTNVDGTMNVLRAARARGGLRIVHTSTSEVYGTACRVPIDETHPLQPQSPYSASKIAADMMAEAFYRSFDVPVTIVRPFNTFGPRQSLRAIVPSIILQCLRSDRISLGHTSPTRDLTFVEDTVAGFLALGEADSAIGAVVNLGTGREISVGDLAQLIASKLKKKITVDVESRRLRPQKSEVERLLANPTLAATHGWKSSVSLEDGLDLTIEWLTMNQHLYGPDSYQL
jgi:NAD dependent epimerase/dehydratase